MRRIVGLIGRKLGHSWSPQIHRRFGCRGYKLYELEPEELEGFLRRPDLGAVNVTIPYKQEVFKYLDEVDPAARDIGAVNTVVNRKGRLFGYNTDKYGLEYAILRAGLDFSGKKVVILGSGGTSHTSVALLDAVKAVGIPTVEVHISDPDTREPFRKVSYIRAACVRTVKGQGFAGYLTALRFLALGA